MVRLEQFLKTGELGPIHPGMKETGVKDSFGAATGRISFDAPTNLEVWRAATYLSKQAGKPGTEALSTSAFTTPRAEPIPEPAWPEDFTGSSETTIADVRDFFAKVGLKESDFVSGEDANYLIMPSTRDHFQWHKLHSINFAGPRSGPARKQISIPVPIDVFDQWKTRARRLNKSVSELFVEGMPSMKRQTGSFDAIDGAGRVWTIFIYTDFLDVSTTGNPHAVRDGLKELRNSNGHHVNRIEKGRYGVVGPGIALCSDSPQSTLIVVSALHSQSQVGTEGIVMATIQKTPPTKAKRSLPFLENGDHLDQKTFHARYEARPDVRAELIGGIVYMSSPLKQATHAREYESFNGLRNTKLRLPAPKRWRTLRTLWGQKAETQPDASLIILPECGGQTSFDKKGYLTGMPS